MFVTSPVPQPFSTPGWKTEKKYSTKVLVGNWVEERRKFAKATDHSPRCTCGKEYVFYPNQGPDHISRWYGRRRGEGLPYKNLTTHHQELPHRHLVSTYEDHYNRHSYNPCVPPLRIWNGQRLLWLPEKSDFPLIDPPTNYGLFKQLKQKWLTSKTCLKESIYSTSYLRPPVWAMSRREHALLALPAGLQPIPRF
ncbi:cilia- and flagella-associated protein 107 [Psammomys obesus]|uniref:cilia- and flagella-associated protein 107 n=1 Tax=Psammomys obesus TaxID=48139 RepID=UPI00245286EA|nr:cilia- and flagella-associated protein 107 [Psammomys obesus]